MQVDCNYCGEPFEAKNKNAKFCSNIHRAQYSQAKKKESQGFSQITQPVAQNTLALFGLSPKDLWNEKCNENDALKKEVKQQSLKILEQEKLIEKMAQESENNQGLSGLIESPAIQGVMTPLLLKLADKIFPEKTETESQPEDEKILIDYYKKLSQSQKGIIFQAIEKLTNENIEIHEKENTGDRA